MENNLVNKARIAVMGIGGAGCNVISSLYRMAAPFHTIAVNTDKAVLVSSSADSKIYICQGVTNGQGARGDVGLGRNCAEAHIEDVRQAVRGFDAVFIVAGLGGGTGTGATATVARVCHEMGIMTAVYAIQPFCFEGPRVQVASKGLESIRAVCRNVITLSNDALLDCGDLEMDVLFNMFNGKLRDMICQHIDRINVEMNARASEVEHLLATSEVGATEAPLSTSVPVRMQ